MQRPLGSSRGSAPAACAIEPLENRVLLSVTLASTTASGTQLNANSQDSALSADGRFLAFTSPATNVVPGPAVSGASDVYLKDLQTGAVALISINAAGTGGGNAPSDHPAVSADGHFVAFESAASDLTATSFGQPVGTNVFLRDTQTGTTTLLSADQFNEGFGNAESRDPSISADGHLVAFSSDADNLVPNDTNQNSDVFVRNVQAATTTLVSAGAAGTAANGGSIEPALSADGLFVAFTSTATNLVPNYTPLATDVFERDLQAGATRLVSADTTNTGGGNHPSGQPTVSGDGRFVAFTTSASNLTPEKPAADVGDVLLRDTQTGTTTLISVNRAGTRGGNEQSSEPHLSSDWRFVVFDSQATDLVVGANSAIQQVYSRDLATGTTALLSLNTSGTGGSNQPAFASSTTADGRLVSFFSNATDLAPADANSSFDVFVATNPADTTPPTASLSAPAGPFADQPFYDFVLTYADNVAPDPLTLDDTDLLVRSEGGVTFTDLFEGVLTTTTHTVLAEYRILAPPGGFNPADNPLTVTLQAGRVSDTSGNFASPATLGTITVLPASGQTTPAEVDPNFGSGGAVPVDFGVEQVAAQPDGRAVVAGHSGDPTGNSAQSFLQRFNPDGSVDLTFGTNGLLVISATSTTNTVARAVAVQSDGRIVVAGQTGAPGSFDFFLARYNTNGSPDTTFNSTGQTTTDFGPGDDAAYAVLVQADGKILLAGTSGGDFALARYNTNGSLDTSFHGTGTEVNDLGSPADVIGALAATPDGHVFAAGSSGGAAALARYNADGSPDPTFNGTGTLRLAQLVADNQTTGLTVQSDGKPIVAARTPGGDFATARLNQGGSLDTTFATTGIAVADFGSFDDADAVLIEPATAGTMGDIIVVGTTGTGSNPAAAVVAYLPDGTPDPNFAGTGASSVAVPLDRTRAVLQPTYLVQTDATLAPDGRVLVATLTSAGAAGPSSTLRRLAVPGSAPNPPPASSNPLGQFGLVNGKKNQKFTATDPGGVPITFSLKGAGTGTVFRNDDNSLSVTVNNAGNSTLALTSRGIGTIKDIKAGGGALKSVQARTTNLTGTLTAPFLSTVQIGSVTGGTIAAVGLSSVQVSGALSSARILAGTSLGADLSLGGGDDTPGVAVLKSVKVNGPATNSLIAAGLDPVNGTYLDADDTLLPGSTIKSVTINGAIDPPTRILAATLPKTARIGGAKVSPTTDSHFHLNT